MIISGGVLLSAVISYFLFKNIPNFLEKNKENSTSILKYYVINSIISYFLLIPFFALMIFIIALLFSSIHNKDFITFIIIFSLWMPLWWFIPVGLGLGWFKYQKKINKDV